MTSDEKIETIGRLYDEGASLATIVAAVGSDDESLRIVGYQLGRSVRKLREQFQGPAVTDLDAQYEARIARARRKIAKLHSLTVEEVEAELAKRNAARARNLELSIVGPPRSRFAYASAITRGDRAIVELEDRLRDLRRREDWR